MSHSTLPQPIKAFLQATAGCDRASFADDAVCLLWGLADHRRAKAQSLANPG